MSVTGSPNGSLHSYRVLVLNQTFEPLHFCNARRALVLVLKGKAEDIECDGHLIHTPSLAFRLPTVIRLMTFIRRPHGGGIAFSKKNVFRRDNYSCQYCGSQGKNLTIDHVVPKSRGGSSNWENVVVACQRCNVKKGNRTLREAQMHLLRMPRKPYFLLGRGAQDLSSDRSMPAWRRYLPDELLAPGGRHH